MGILNWTALVIANNPHVKANVGGPAENGKYVGWIEIEESDETKYRPLLNTKPMFDTEKEALDAMQKDIDFIKVHKEEHIEKLSKDICQAAQAAGIKDGSYK